MKKLIISSIAALGLIATTNPGGAGAKLRARDRPLANDFVTDEEFGRLLHAWFGNLARVLQPGRAFYLWGAGPWGQLQSKGNCARSDRD